MKYDVIIINFANPDMVGHTGVEEAAIKAVEAVFDWKSYLREQFGVEIEEEKQ